MSDLQKLLIRRNLAVYDCAWNLVKKLDAQLFTMSGKSAKELNKEFGYK